MSGLEELDRGYAQNKGWKAPADVLKSYREFEKFKGVPQERLLALPDKEDDAEGWAKVHARLGRPEKPEDYALDTGNPEHSAMIAKVMHESGISKAAAAKIVQADLDWRKASDEAARVSTASKLDDIPPWDGTLRWFLSIIAALVRECAAGQGGGEVRNNLKACATGAMAVRHLFDNSHLEEQVAAIEDANRQAMLAAKHTAGSVDGSLLLGGDPG